MPRKIFTYAFFGLPLPSRRYSLYKIKRSAVSIFILARLARMMDPPTEKSLSTEADVAGNDKYLAAREAKIGNRSSLSRQ